MRDTVRQTWMLVDSAPPQDWGRHLVSLSDLLRPVLESAGRLPAGLIDAVVAGDRADLHEALARNGALLAAVPGLRTRLAATGSAGVARIALDGWTLGEQRLALSSARPEDPAWHEAKGVVVGLLAQTDVQRLRAAVGAPFPEVVRRVLAVGGEQLSVAERLRALQTLHVLEGADAVAGAVPAGLEPVLPAELSELAALTQLWEGTHGAIQELYQTGFPERVRHLALRETLDWAMVLAAHARQPFDDVAAAGLAERPDCPEDVVLALHATSPAAVAAVAAVSEALLLASSAGPGAVKIAAKTIRVLARRAIEAGIGGSLLLEELRPAVAVLEAARQRPGGAADGDPAGARAGAAWDEFSAGLEKLVTGHLADDIAAWRSVRSRLKTFPGTVAELLRSGQGTDGGGKAARQAAWPDPAELPDLTKATSVTGPRAAFVTLLDAAPTGVQLALLPVLDDRTVHDLLMHGRWRAGWLDHVVEHGPAAARLSLAGRGSLGAEEIGRLATLDDPVVNGLLFQRANATSAQRTRLLSGRPLGPGRTEPVPLDPAFRQRLLAKTGGWSGRDALDCPDLEVQRHILRHVRLRGRIPQLHLLLELWERHGPAAVAELIDANLRPVNYTRNPFQVQAKKTIKALLDRPDVAAAQAELRAEVIREESPAVQIETLRMKRTDHVNLFRESHDWHWPELLAEHRRLPFDEPVVGMMGRSRGCPEELRRASRGALLPWSSDEERDLVAGSTPEDVLTGGPLTRTDWLPRALAAGRVTGEQALRHGHPARTVLVSLSRDNPEWPAAGRMATSAALAGMVAATIGDNPDGWVLALRLLPDFPGTLPELLQTAAAVVS